MSAYLTFRKNGIDLVSFNRSMLIVEVIGTPNSEDWKPFEMDPFHWAYKELNEKEQAYTEHLQLLDKAFQAKLDTDTVYDLMNDYRETKEQLDEIRMTRNYMDLLKDIFEEDTYLGDDKELKPVIEWSYG